MAHSGTEKDVSEDYERSLVSELGSCHVDFVARAYDLLAAEIEDLREHSRW